MGGMGEMLKMMPGLGKMAGALEDAGVDDSMLKKQEALILSMTQKERANPDLLNASRKKRIAAGAGSSVQELNKLCKQQKQMATMMKKMKKMGMGGMMKQMKGLMGGKMDDLEMMAGSMDPDGLAKDMAELKGDGGALGPNPFAGGGMPSGLPGGLPGLGGPAGLPGLGGLSSHGGKKKNRKKGKKR